MQKKAIAFILSIFFIAGTSLFLSSCLHDKNQPIYLNPESDIELRVNDLLSRMTLDEKISLLYVTNPPIERLGIKEYHYGNEALHGIVRRNGKATVFPQAIALAATWNPDLMLNIASAIGDEARAKHNENQGVMKGGEIWGGQFDGLLTFFSPTINMARDPRWGRTGETYGEDPHLTSEMAKAFINGMQGDHNSYLKTICTPKHFVANNEEHNRFKCNVEISETTLREYYLKAFETAVVDAKAGAIMSAYNAINGVPCSANKWLLTDLLRNEWGFDGYVVTDCGAIKHLYQQHNYVKDSLEAAVEALTAGVDMECGNKKDLSSNIKIALEKGLINSNEVDRAVGNILRGRFRLGLFDPEELIPYNRISPEVVGCNKHRRLALQSALESIVLLKNKPSGQIPLLPVDFSIQRKILVVGPNADRFQFGEKNYSGIPVNAAITPLKGLQEIVPDSARIFHLPWIETSKMKEFHLLSESIVPGTSEYGFSATYQSEINEIALAPLIRTDPVIDFDWENMPPDPFLDGKEFQVEWKGEIPVRASGLHHLKVEYNGAYMLQVGPHTFTNVNLKSLQGDTIYTLGLNQGDTLRFALVYQSKGLDFPLISIKWKLPFPAVDPLVQARKSAENADIVVAFMGLDSNDAVENKDRANLDLPAEQLQFVKELYSVNRNIIVVLINGNPLSVNWIDEHVPAVLEAWFPGEQGGRAIAEVLTGQYNPAGRLPLTFYRSVEQLPPFDSYEIYKGHTYMYVKDKPLYPFGHGLSYTSFDYDSLEIEMEQGKLEIQLLVTNTGPIDGEEVVQLYFSSNSASQYAPNKKLFAFRRIKIITGQTELVRFIIDPESTFSTFNTLTGKFDIMPENVVIMAGSSSEKILEESNINLQ